MNKSLFMLSAFLLIVATSCSKSNNDQEPTQDKVCKVKMMEHSYSYNNVPYSEKYYYTYNTDGRIARVDYGKEQSNEFESYAYAGNRVTWKGVGGDVELYNLDANGRITTAVQGEDILNFKYNSDGNLIEGRIDDQVETFAYSNGNLTSAAYNSEIWSSFVYGTDVSSNAVVQTAVFGDKFLDFDEISFRVIPYIGKTSKNLPSKAIINQGTRDQITYDYVYQKDATGNVNAIKVKVTEAANVQTTEEFKFTYECK